MPPLLAGAFTSSGGMLPETKAEKREKAEIAELKAFDAPPKWSSTALLAQLRARAKAEGIAPIPPSQAPLVLNEAITRATSVARMSYDVTTDGDTEPTGEWWAVLPSAEGNEADGKPVLCLGQDANRRLRAAVAWWPAALYKNKLSAADASRVLLLDDPDGKDQPALALGHPTVIGVGDEGKPGPASRDMQAAGVLHLAEASRLYLLAKAQVSARLQRGGASTDEKGLVKLLLREAYHRLTASSAAEFDFSQVAEPTDLTEPVGLNRAESALAGLRKMYLPRSWEDRCITCGTRHTMIEHGTCKFWVRWANEAREREAAEKTEPAAAPAPPPKSKAPAEAKEEASAAGAGEEVEFVPFLPKLQAAADLAAADDKENAASPIE